jgi:multisubunit Na+/H+ antiporter MnhB subunit
MEIRRVRRRQGRVAVALIWLLVLVAVFLVAAKTNDPGGAGELGAAVGIALTSLYFFLRRARSWEDLMPTPNNAPVGSATAAWIRLVVMFLLWVAASVILILLRVPDGYAVILGWLLPLAAFLVYRRRRSAGHG